MNNDLRDTHCARNFINLQDAYAAIEIVMEHTDGEMDSLSIETLEKDILKITDGLATHIIASRIQAQLDSETQRTQEKEVLDALPGNLRNEGLETVNIRTATGLTIPLKLRYYRRRCDNKPGKRHKGVYPADHVLFIADGAHWIWNRASPLMSELELKETQVHELIDFYHAVEHVSKIAALRKNLTSSERKKWISKQCRRLQKGQVEKVVEDVQSFCRGRLSKALSTERDYFIRNEKRMNYAEIKALNLPIGSGAIESSMRRVINLRLKGPCIFWLKENAEKISMLRAYSGLAAGICLNLWRVHIPIAFEN